jgi:dTDP-4-dehydrorhamnose 3,5-epimerase
VKVTALAIPDVLLLQPQRHEDERGFLIERYERREFDAAAGCAVEFVQHNQSRSRRGVLRGLHYQTGLHAQGKLVWAGAGRIFDVAVDLRPGSPSFGRWVGAELSDDNACQLWIPAGFAHGFLVLSESADVDYQLTAPHDPAHARTLRWDDPAIGIAWPTAGRTPILSPRDAAAPLLAQAVRL